MKVLFLAVSIGVGACVAPSALLAQDNVAAAEAPNELVTVSLYGNNFSIEPSFLDRMNGDSTKHQWQDVAYLVPQVLPGIRDGEDMRSIDETLKTIANLTIAYRNLYDVSIDNLAQDLVDAGHFQIAEINEDAPFMRERLQMVLSKGGKEADALTGYILVWFRNQEWEEKVKKYDDATGESVAIDFDFALPYKNYERFVALFYLDTLVRRSPEFREFAANYNLDSPKEVHAP